MDEGSILGLNLDATTLHVGKVRKGRLEARFFDRISSDGSKDKVLGEIYASIDQVMGDDVVGIGFGAPSIVDTKSGVVRSVANIPSWREVPLGEYLAERYGVPVYVDNDANAFTVGELHFGCGRGVRHMVGIILGTGLGLGLVYDGRLRNGANCGAGEIGRLPYRDADFEHYGSLKFFERATNLREFLLRSRAEKGHEKAVKVYRFYGRQLGKILQTVLYVYDPELIVLGGPLAGALPLYERSLRASLAKDFAYPRMLETLRIEASATGNDGPILGAAALYLDSLRKETAEAEQGLDRPARGLSET